MAEQPDKKFVDHKKSAVVSVRALLEKAVKAFEYDVPAARLLIKQALDELNNPD